MNDGDRFKLQTRGQLQPPHPAHKKNRELTFGCTRHGSPTLLRNPRHSSAQIEVEL
jgi:hypothetical protein